MSSVNENDDENKLTLEDVIRRTPGVTNLYDMFGLASMYNLRQSNRTFKNLLENELRIRFVKKEETESVYLVVTQLWMGFLRTTKEYFSPNSIHRYFYSYEEDIPTQRRIQQDMRQKMIEGKCFINYHLHHNTSYSQPFVYIFAFKLHGCDEL